MFHQRSGTFTKRFLRKLIFIVIVVIGIRFLVVSLFFNQSSLKIHTREIDGMKHAVQFEDEEVNAVNRHFKFSEYKIPESDSEIQNNHENGDKRQGEVTSQRNAESMNTPHDQIKDERAVENKQWGKGLELTTPELKSKTHVQETIRKSVDSVTTQSSVKLLETDKNRDQRKTLQMLPGNRRRDEDPQKINKQPTNLVTSKVHPVASSPNDKGKKNYGSCSVLKPWTENENHAMISTYDLFQNVSYSMNSQGQYPIPVRQFEEIANTGSHDTLTVILVPFSHADPGYGLTLEQYYAQKTRSTLNSMVAKLQQYPNMTFQWAETVYLERWFQDIDQSTKDVVKQLIKRGQLEIVLGGWVMPDEASPNYVAVVDQLIEGHQWLIENLEIKPRSAWVNDPFGYSSTMPYLWKLSGMENLLFLRINQPVKAKLMKLKSLDFIWRPYWETTGKSDVLASLMSYTNYWASDVCGPAQKICDEFNFLHSDRSVAVTSDNVAKQAEKLYQQFRITGDLYKYNTLYIGLGEDFSYSQPYDWDNMYTNYEKLINYINSNKHWNMHVKFGTLSEYFDKVRSEDEKMAEEVNIVTKSDASFTTLSGDFFPYTERNQEFWTGYFTSRPLNKRFSRELETVVRAADIFNVMVYSLFKHYQVEFTAEKAIADNLRQARRELGMFMHHDGITGTSLPHVVQDFEVRLFKAYMLAQTAFKSTLVTMLSKGKNDNSSILQEELVKPQEKKMTGSMVLTINEVKQVILVNTMSKRRKEIVNLFVNSDEFEVLCPRSNIIPYQINDSEGSREKSPSVASFEVELPAFAVEVYTLRPAKRPRNRTVVREESAVGSDGDISIENEYMTVKFNNVTGMMEKIIDRNGKVTNMSANFLVYLSKTSGVYIFGPAGPAYDFKTGERFIKVTRGPLVSEVAVSFAGFFISVKLYNCSGLQGQGLHIRTEVDMAAIQMREMEVILRFNTDIKSGQNFYTDQNGFQLIGRQNKPEIKIEANYYPVTTMAIIEDQSKRFTLHCKQPHGSASLKEGQLEVMLDRTTYRDDGRGLGQGVFDNVKVNSEFIVHIEHKTTPFKPAEVRFTYPSQESLLINNMLQNGVLKYIVQDTGVHILKEIHPLKTAEIPCDVSVVGLRNLVKNNLEYNSTSLVLHRVPVHCGFRTSLPQCKEEDGVLTARRLFPKLKVHITETSLSHLCNISEMTVDSDITPKHSELRAFRIVF